MDRERFPTLVEQLYGIVTELEAMFGRPFTPDGHMVGSIGESLAAHYYGLRLAKPSTAGYDATRGRLEVEIKATQRTSVAFRGEPPHLLVLLLKKNGTFEEVYNGNGSRVWATVAHKPRPKNGQWQVSLNVLRRLAKQVEPGEAIPRVR